MAAPAVRDLQSLIATQQQALQPQLGLIDESIAANDKSGVAQVAGIEAKKSDVFTNQIPQQAQDNGMFFSGFTPDEEAKYTASTYLPALAALQGTIAQTRSSLLGKKADLGKGAYDVATQQQEADRQVLADWNKMTAQQQFEASQSEKQRAFEAKQRQADRDASAKEGAANRSASAAKAPNPKADAAAALRAYVGDDGYVSPGTWGSVKSQWIGGGYGTGADFDKAFAGFKNPKQKGYR